ncbi:MAG: hypothetical protein HKN17_02870, partial [Rhodothermales bacterium]|nr:hypothetical protein [Rhodothermales bacterium]
MSRPFHRIRTTSAMLVVIAWAFCAADARAQEEDAGVDARERDLPARVDTLSVVGPGPFIIRPFIRPGALSIRV